MGQTTDLVLPDPKNGVELEVDHAREVIRGLRESGDSQSLHQISVAAAMSTSYLTRQKNLEQARKFQVAVALSESALGILDVRDTLRLKSNDEPLVLNGVTISTGARTRWRRFGVAEMRNGLNLVIDELLAAEKSLGSNRIDLEVRLRGFPYTPWSPVRRVVRETDPAIVSGLAYGDLLKEGPRNSNDALNYLAAHELFTTIGLDPTRLKPIRSVRGTYATAEDAVTRAAREKAAAARVEAERLERQARARRISKANGGAAAELYAMVERMQDVLAAAELQAGDNSRRFHNLGPIYRQLRDETVSAVLGA